MSHVHEGGFEIGWEMIQFGAGSKSGVTMNRHHDPLLRMHHFNKLSSEAPSVFSVRERPNYACAVYILEDDLQTVTPGTERMNKATYKIRNRREDRKNKAPQRSNRTHGMARDWEKAW